MPVFIISFQVHFLVYWVYSCNPFSVKIKLQALRVAGALIRVAGEMRRLPAYFDNPAFVVVTVDRFVERGDGPFELQKQDSHVFSKTSTLL